MAENGPYRVRLQLRWGDVDQLGHVNNVCYLEYTQEARLRYMRERLADAAGGAGGGIGAVVVRRLEVGFDRSLMYSEDGIDVTVWPTRLGTSSFTLRHEIRDPEGTLYSSMDAVIVAVDLEAGRSRPLPDHVRAAITAELPAAGPA